MSKKKLDSKEVQIANNFAASYEKCINSCRDIIKFCEDTDKYLFIKSKPNFFSSSSHCSLVILPSKAPTRNCSLITGILSK